MEQKIIARFGLEVQVDLCNACGTCIEVCPENALILENEQPVLTRVCQVCGACESICPKGALALEFTIE